MKYYGLIIPSVFPTGVFIQDIRQTTSSNESEGVNTMTVTLTNQQKTYFHVKNGKQGSDVEATAQMEQHAKEYIASELAEQKKALDQTIHDVAKKADTEFERLIQAKEKNLQNKINEVMATAETKLLEKQNKTIINLLQNGYIQWPGMPNPDKIFNFPGYRWVEVDYKGCFFRAKGSNANSFDGGEQGDAIRNIIGRVDTAFSAHCFYDLYEKEDGRDFPHYAEEGNAMMIQSSAMQRYRVSTYSIQDLPEQQKHGAHIKINASLAVPTAEENRPRNRTIIIWKLEKI